MQPIASFLRIAERRLSPRAYDRSQTPKRIFPEASTDARAAKHVPSRPRPKARPISSPSRTPNSCSAPDLRPVRFQLELLKPELLMNEANIASTFVFYGSARVPEPSKAQGLLEAARSDWDKKVAERLVAKSHYYDEARKLAARVSKFPVDEDGKRHFVVCSGGGPSFMEAANRGAQDVGSESIGLNIVLPHEQLPNNYVTPDLSFQFHYFALRKMHFLLRARAVAVFPGGFGTFDEMFELLTLIQTGKVRPLPILLFGRRILGAGGRFPRARRGRRDQPHDLDLITWVETAEEAWDAVCAHYEVC